MGFETVLDTRTRGFPSSMSRSPLRRLSAADGQSQAHSLDLPSNSCRALLLTICIPSRPRPSFGKAELGRAALKSVTATMGRLSRGVHESRRVFHRFLAIGFSFGSGVCLPGQLCHDHGCGRSALSPLLEVTTKPARGSGLEQKQIMEWWHLKVVNMSLASDPPSVNQSILAASVGTRTKRRSLRNRQTSILTRTSQDAIAAYRKAVPRSLSPQQVGSCWSLAAPSSVRRCRGPMPFTGSSSKRFRIIPTCWRSTTARFCGEPESTGGTRPLPERNRSPDFRTEPRSEP